MKLRMPAPLKAHSLTKKAQRKARSLLYDGSLYSFSPPTATRPLAIEKHGTWYTYALDLSKNVTVLYTSEGSIATSYIYSPFGAVTIDGDVGSLVQ